MALLLAAVLLAACSARAPVPRSTAPDAARPDTLETPARSLPDLLLSARAAASFNEDLLYTPPPDTALGQYAFQLHREPATLTLFDKVIAFQATDQSLAVSLADSSIRLFGDRPCSGLILPDGPAHLVAWLPGSRWLAACDAARLQLLVIDTQTCSRATRQTLHGEIQALAVSPSGTWLAAADASGTLWLATPPREAAPLAHLAAPCLALDFSDNDGVLLAASSDGTVLLLAPSTGQTLGSFHVPGEPFASARFTDGHLELTSTPGATTSIDLATRKPAGLERRETGFHLADGLLTYRTWYNVPQQKLLPGPLRLSLSRSPDASQYRVSEPDGSERCYAATSLAQTPCVAANDWEDIPLDPQDATACLKGRCLALADRVFQVEHRRLLCRFVPGQGFFLWWVHAERPNSANPLQGHLPVRQTLDPNETVRWIPLNPPKDLP